MNLIVIPHFISIAANTNTPFDAPSPMLRSRVCFDVPNLAFIPLLVHFASSRRQPELQRNHNLKSALSKPQLSVVITSISSIPPANVLN